MADESGRRVPRNSLGGAFAYDGVVEAYRHRPPYPDRVFEILRERLVDPPARVLDLGAGEGALARRLASPEFAEAVAGVDAVDVSAAMLEAGRRRPGGEATGLHWIQGDVTTPELTGPYGLAVAGASLHWMEPVPTMTRLAELLVPGAELVVIEHGATGVAWREPLVEQIRRFSRASDWDPTYSVVRDVTARGLFESVGAQTTEPVPYEQAVGDYVESFHSTATLAREHLSTAEAEEFDDAVRGIVAPYATDGVLTLPVVAELTWGRPLSETR